MASEQVSEANSRWVNLYSTCYIMTIMSVIPSSWKLINL